MTRSRDHTKPVTQVEAEAGTAVEGKIWSPERVLQSIAANASASPLTTKGDIFAYDTDDQRLAIGADTFVLTADSAEATGLKWAAATDEKSYNRPGLLTIFAGVARWYPSRDITISTTRANVGLPATTKDILINIKKNGIAVITALTIPQTAYLSAADATVINLTTADYITIDVTQIGTSIPGQDLAISFKYT